MGYCQVTDIENDIKGASFTANSTVTDTAVAQFIVEAGALIDSYVGNRYVTPVVSDSSSLALMSLYCRILVRDRVRSILEVKQATNTDANQNIVGGTGFSTSGVMKSLNDIKNGDSNLSGAVLLNLTASFMSNNFSRGECPRFRKDRKQW